MIMSKVEYLLVTCNKEQTRYDIMKKTVENLRNVILPYVQQDCFTVIDNASTVGDTIGYLKTTFENVYVASQNIGYWSAIDWWLEHIKDRGTEYVYIIESDLIHNNDVAAIIGRAIAFLDKNKDFGTIRTHKWSYANRRLYDKDRPLHNSDRTHWRTHTNYVTKKRVEILPTSEPEFYRTTFLSQLPAINRFDGIHAVFKQLRMYETFPEPEFQKLYYEYYERILQSPPFTGMIDGGIFCDLTNDKMVCGSYTPTAHLSYLGYCSTRIGNITESSQYTIKRA